MGTKVVHAHDTAAMHFGPVNTYCGILVRDEGHLTSDRDAVTCRNCLRCIV